MKKSIIKGVNKGSLCS